MNRKRIHPVKPKYQKLFESLKADILSGRFKPGQKLPSEAALVNKSGASRITVGRAIRELQNIGLIDRIAGSGTYIKQLDVGDRRPYLFGLLIPDLGETEIFEPICQGIANAPEASEHALLWGHADTQASKAEQAWRLCRQYISRTVSGVFFAPLEFESDADKINRRILAALKQAQIPVVLLDRRASKTPERHRPDLVGINNHQAGYIATEHLIKLGCDRIGFLGYHGSATTISDRMAGYRDALAAHGLRPAGDPAAYFEGSEQSLKWRAKTAIEDVEAFVCVNDRIAGHLMHVLLARNIRVPEDMRLVGIDDVSYASLLPVPLTTVHQPAHEIGEAALRAMLDRIHSPHLPPREVLLDGELVIRQSCGAESSSLRD
ncbi:MAG TPA: GntR family transcriptional regulator [Bryobacteraceae bacterium]|jgi:DNA-binding LacI/PurR family transcriptional regulator|nr:GntR family transcriptional regulator [Bryobacteraceae bacterium]